MLRLFWLLACCVLWTSTAHAQVVNGDFETGNLSGWTETSNGGGAVVVSETDMGFSFPSPTNALYLDIYGLGGWFSDYGRVESASFVDLMQVPSRHSSKKCLHGSSTFQRISHEAARGCLVHC